MLGTRLGTVASHQHRHPGMQRTGQRWGEKPKVLNRWELGRGRGWGERRAAAPSCSRRGAAPTWHVPRVDRRVAGGGWHRPEYICQLQDRGLRTERE